MKLTIMARQTEISDDLKELFEKKISKLDKFFRDDASAYITLSRVRNLERLELTVTSGGTLFRSEEEDSTFNNAFDRALDTIERQIRKNKTRLEKRLRDGAFAKENFEDASSVDEEREFNIRVKKFPIKAMSPEEAILQMNLLGHMFFVFVDAETGDTSVVYKRHDGYGMIVPAN